MLRKKDDKKENNDKKEKHIAELRESYKKIGAHTTAKIISRHLKEEYIAIPTYIKIDKGNIRGYTFEKKRI